MSEPLAPYPSEACNPASRLHETGGTSCPPNRVKTGTASPAVIGQDAISVVREQPRQLEPLRLVPSAHVSKGDPHLAGAKETALQANPAIPGQKNWLGHRQQVGLLKRWEL